jgi:hypothetical protein
MYVLERERLGKPLAVRGSYCAWCADGDDSALDNTTFISAYIHPTCFPTPYRWVRDRRSARGTEDGGLTWETWTEQTCLSAPATPGCTDSTKKTRFLHVSHLSARNDPTKRPAGDCNSMVTQQSFSGPNPAPPSLKPFVPKNVTHRQTDGGDQELDELDESSRSATRIPKLSAGGCSDRLPTAQGNTWSGEFVYRVQRPGPSPTSLLHHVPLVRHDEHGGDSTVGKSKLRCLPGYATSRQAWSAPGWELGTARLLVAIGHHASTRELITAGVVSDRVRARR